MSDTPERILVDRSESLYLCAEKFKDHPDDPPSVEYIRADHVNELVAAAYEVASNEVAMEWADEDMPCEGVGEHLRLTIINLTPADATAALAARDARVREAALREAADAVIDLRMLNQGIVMQWNEAIDEASDRIEALIEKDTING